MMQKQSVILLGHGSKSNEAVDDFLFIVDTIKAKSDNKNIYCAHMELASPSLEEVVEKLYHEGQTNLIVIPYFLFNGNHIKEDIPEKIEALKQRYSGIEIKFGNPIGKEPLMADIMLKKVEEIL